MIQASVSPLQLHALRKLPSGMTSADHLSNAYLTEPEKLDGVLAFAFGTQNENVLSLLTGGLGNTRFIDNSEYKWELHGQVERSIEISADPVTTSAKPGFGGTGIVVNHPVERNGSVIGRIRCRHCRTRNSSQNRNSDCIFLNFHNHKYPY